MESNSHSHVRLSNEQDLFIGKHRALGFETADELIEYAVETLRRKVNTAAHDRQESTLTEKGFWELLELLDWEKAGDDAAVVEPLVARLAQLPLIDLEQFAELLAEKLYRLDGRRYAENIGENSFRPGVYFSPDTFLYVRCCVVANGKEYYEHVLAHPEDMPQDLDFEPLLYVAESAHARQTGEKSFDYVTEYSYETYSNQDGWNLADS